MMRITQGSQVKANAGLIGSPATEQTSEGHFGFSILANHALLQVLHRKTLANSGTTLQQCRRPHCGRGRLRTNVCCTTTKKKMLWQSPAPLQQTLTAMKLGFWLDCVSGTVRALCFAPKQTLLYREHYCKVLSQSAAVFATTPRKSETPFRSSCRKTETVSKSVARCTHHHVERLLTSQAAK